MRAKHARGQSPRTARAVYESGAGPNMTPMVDVVMVILIFFMASAAILGPEWFVKSSLPVHAIASEPLTDALPPVQLKISLDGDRIVLKYQDAAKGGPVSEPITPDRAQLAAALRTLRERARSERRDIITLIIPSADTAYERVVSAHEAAVQAGLEPVGIAPADLDVRDEDVKSLDGSEVTGGTSAASGDGPQASPDPAP